MAAPNPIKAPLAPAQFTPLSLLRMVWLHRLAILLIWIVSSSITAIIVRALPAEYRAEVSILVDPQKIPSSVVQSMVTTNVQDRLATISQQILSTAQLQKVIDDFGLYRKEKKDLIAEEIVQLMRTNIRVALDKGWTNNTPGAFRIAYTGEDPAVVAQVANRLGNLFIEENMRTRETQVEGTSEFLETQLADAKKRLDEAEAQISGYKLKHNGELPEQMQVIAANLNRLQSEQNGNRDAIVRAEQSKKVLEDTLGLAETNLQELIERDNTPAPVSAAPAARTGLEPAEKPAPQRALTRSELLEIELAAAKAKWGDAHPEVRKLRRDIAVAKAAEEKLASEEPPPAPKPPVETKADPKPVEKAAVTPAPAKPARERAEVVQARERIRLMRAQIEQNDKDIVNRKDEQEKILKAIENERAKIANVPVREQEISQIMRDHASLSAEYHSLLEKSNQAKISTDMELRQKSERFAINDPAHVPGKPSSPDRVALNAFGALIGLALGFVVAIVQEFHKNRLLGAWELPDEAPVLIHVPRIAPVDGGVVGMWAGWRWSRRLVVLSAVLIPILAALLAVRFYLR
jgi:polysaccharide chain length determinant protein (PEP-CTERM system associated)